MGTPITWTAWTLAGGHQPIPGSVLRFWVHAMVWMIDPGDFLFRSGPVGPATILAATLALAGLGVLAMVAAGTRATAALRPRRRHPPDQGRAGPKGRGPVTVDVATQPGWDDRVRPAPTVRMDKGEVFAACQALADADRCLLRAGHLSEARALGDLFELFEERLFAFDQSGAGS